MSEQGNTKEAGLLASWPVCGIHPSEWIELDREDLNKAAGVTFSDEHYGQLMGALHNYQLAQQVRLPPLVKIEERLDQLANKPDQASRILANSKPNNVEFFDPSDRNYRRCRDYVNYHIWHLLAAQGAYVPIGCDEPFSLSLDQIEAARESARFLAQADRPKGSSTKGRPIQPGLLELIDEIIRVWRAAGGRGAIWYLDRTNDKWCGFLYETLTLLLKAADYIMHLEAFHGGNPSSVSDNERVVGKAELDDYISECAAKDLCSQIGEKTVYRYRLRNHHSLTAD